MSAPTIDVIALVGNQLHPGLTYHPTTIAYIRFLVQQYFGAPETITNEKVDYVNYILIMKGSGDLLQYLPDRTVFPWDVQTFLGIKSTDHLTQGLGVTMNDRTLPVTVTVTIGNENFTHMLSD